jgi:sugar O-acyltransferase (sialic acid O-acetyltransferase NeuD family)
MKNIAIIGASGLGRELWTLINAINDVELTYNVLGFYDDSFVNEYEVIAGVNCLGTITDLMNDLPDGTCITFGMANRDIVDRVYNLLSRKRNFRYPNLIHPRVSIEYGSVLGIGNVIATSTLISCEVKIGDFNFFNSMCAVGHDTVIGNFNCFMPRAQISGDVSIGNFNNFSMGTSIVQGKKMGDRNTILAYSLLTKSIKNDRKYFGIPAKRLDL